MVGHLRVYGNKDLKNEEIESAELIYIYSDNKDKLKLNLFYSIYKMVLIQESLIQININLLIK